MEKIILLLITNLCTSALLAQRAPLRVFHNDVPAVREEYRKAYGVPVEAVPATDRQPNMLFITSDQQYWMGVGYNDTTLKTPNLDRLAKSGMIFDRAYTCNPVCTPARASMITGMYPSQHGAYALGTKLPETVPTVGDYLKELGYRTALVGKAHFMPLAGNAEYPSLEAYPVLQDLDFWTHYRGPFYGFESVELARPHGDEAHVGQHYALWMERKLKEAGHDPATWKQWYRKPRQAKFNAANAVMRPIMEEHAAQGNAQNGVWNIPGEYHLNAWIADQTNAQIDVSIKDGRPFFVWASFFDPHPPYLVPEPWASMYDPEDMVLPEVPQGDLDDMPHHYRMTQTNQKGWNKQYMEDGQGVHGFYSHLVNPEKAKRDKAIYYGMISMMDHYIGKILDHLEQTGQLENTIIVFTTDHGHHLGTHGLYAKGGFAFEEDLRIPFVVSWKDRFPSGGRTDALISVVDLAPTFISLAGGEKPTTMSGVDASALWYGKADKVRDWVITENHFQPTKFYQKTYIEGRYKITWYMHSDEGELFDLQTDPQEFNNLWQQEDFKELKMEMMHRAMQADMFKETAWMPRLGPA
ncbi:sulfatase family protein [Parapedobacter tibetensis]|uniref:sulfatase family protein n=1 Tax=Parapedobacter tibetensis TaxID=2972951 RepID=UPI00214DC029|nr:sulfatase-like hydrolase/transferase [Parapedobacter tibetensis]